MEGAPETLVAQPADHLSPAGTILIVDGLGAGLAALLVIALARRAVHRHREKLAHRAALRQNEPLHPGPTVLAGRVVDEHEGDAIVLSIEQQGREWQNKGSWGHSWTEQRRSLEVAPFYVERANGERVRVEPDARVFLVDKLDGTEVVRRDFRVRRARLQPGEHVFILGELVRAPDPKLGAYRDAEGWVLRPPRSGRMLCSTEPLEARHARRAAVWSKLALAACAALVVWHGLLFVRVHQLRVSGRVVAATVTHTKHWSVWVRPAKGSAHWVQHYAVEALGDEGAALYSEIDSGSWYRISEGSRVAFILLRDDGYDAQLGARATAHSGAAFVGAVCAFIWGLFFAGIALRTRPWWERRRVVEAGTGRL